MPSHACPRQGCRRPTPRSCAAGANGTNMRQWWSARREATASDSNSSYVYRCETLLTIVPRKPHILALPRCTSAESFSRGAGLGDMQLQRARLVFCTVPKAQSSRGLRSNLTFPFGKHARTSPSFPCFPCQPATRSFLRSPLLQTLFLPRAPHLQAAFSREILHL
jgi:hypothetical protein